MPATYELNKAKPLGSSLSVDENFHRVYTSNYRVWTAQTTSPFTAGSATDLPLYGHYYSWNGFVDVWAFAKHFKIVSEQDIKDPITGDIVKQWDVEIKHDSKPTGGSNDLGSGRDNPLADPPVISGAGFVKYVPLDRDINGNPMTNSARTLFDPPIEGLEFVDTINISYNQATINLGLRSQMVGAVNSTNQWNLPPRRIKLNEWTYEILRAGPGFDYVRYNLSFEVSYFQTPTDSSLVNINPELAGKIGYYTVKPDAGPVYFDGGLAEGGDNSDKLKAFTDAKDVVRGDQGYLAQNGDKLPEGQPLHYVIYEAEREQDFHNIPGLRDPLPGPFV